MIYVHVPFCASKCHYCDFYSVASVAGVSQMVGALCDELRERRDLLGGASIPTIYFGGGTPSVLPIHELNRILQTMDSNFDLSNVGERTLEANPEHLTRDYLEGLIGLGFNRLSIGVQSFCDDHLAQMNRRHSALDAQNAVRMAQKVGFENISIDLIYGLPFMTDQQWADNIDRAIGLGVQHISAYHLSIEEGTVFHRRGVQAIDEERSEKQYKTLCRALGEAGFEHYEISSFALAGRRSRHNSGYWTGAAYLGVGPSAHSFDGVANRSWNVASNRLYLSGRDAQSEQLSARDLHNEYLMTQLRTADGIDPERYAALFLRDFAHGETLVFDSGRWRIAESDWLISDAIIASLFEPES